MVSVQGPLVLLHDILHVLVLLIPRNACRFSDFKSSSRINIGICALYYIESVLRIPHARKGKEFPSNLALYKPLNDLKMLTCVVDTIENSQVVDLVLLVVSNILVIERFLDFSVWRHEERDTHLRGAKTHRFLP